MKYRKTEQNKERAGYAQEAVDSYTQIKDLGRYAEEDLETRLSDLLCDLQHIAAQNKIDFDAVKMRAGYNFDAESSGRED